MPAHPAKLFWDAKKRAHTISESESKRLVSFCRFFQRQKRQEEGSEQGQKRPLRIQKKKPQGRGQDKEQGEASEGEWTLHFLTVQICATPESADRFLPVEQADKTAALLII